MSERRRGNGEDVEPLRQLGGRLNWTAAARGDERLSDKHLCSPQAHAGAAGERAEPPPRLG